jgi:hypothetical protein
VRVAGFAAAEEATWPICVEPEYRFFQPEHFEGALERAEELYDSHPNREMMHSDARMHDIYHRSLRDRCRADAIEEALQRHTPELVTRKNNGMTAKVTRERVLFILRPSSGSGCDRYRSI